MKTCINCDRREDVSKGKICDNGHFVCSKCVYGESSISLLFSGPRLTSCPYCKERLR